MWPDCSSCEWRKRQQFFGSENGQLQCLFDELCQKNLSEEEQRRIWQRSDTLVRLQFARQQEQRILQDPSAPVYAASMHVMQLEMRNLLACVLYCKNMCPQEALEEMEKRNS